MEKWHLMQNQQRLREIFKKSTHPYLKGKSLKDLLVSLYNEVLKVIQLPVRVRAGVVKCPSLTPAPTPTPRLFLTIFSPVLLRRTQYMIYHQGRKVREIVGKWHFIQNQQRLREIFKKPPHPYNTLYLITGTIANIKVNSH